MNTQCLLVDRDAGVWRLRLNRPRQGNALSVDLVQALGEALDEAAADHAQVVVLQGEGRHFCTGFDLSGLEGESDDTLLARFVRIELLLQRVARGPFRTVARAHGRTTGAGADLFAACDVRLAHPATSFAFPGARGFGLVLGTRRLAAHVGSPTAIDWAGSGRSVTAQEACDRGLVTGLCELSQSLDEFVQRSDSDARLTAALRRALEGQAQADDARDLDLLVRSAAPRGLRERLNTYATSVFSRGVAAFTNEG